MEAASGTAARELESFSPIDGARLGAVPVTAPERIQSVVDDVAEVQPFWAQLPLGDRARYMRRAAQVIIDNLDELTLLLSREQGKPRNESYTMELLPTIDSLRWIAENGPGILAGERIAMPVFLKQKSARFTYEPLGVVGVIAPWNYPWSIPFGEVAIALMCGNGVVLKPASLTPLIGQRIQEVFERAGLPQGLVRAVHGGGAVGNALVRFQRGEDLLHGLGRGRAPGGRGLRRAAQGLRAGAGRQGRDDRLRRREPAERGVGLPVGRLRQRRADLLGDRARLRGERGGRALHRRRGRGREGAARRRPHRVDDGDRADGLARAVRRRQGARGRRGRRRARRCAAAGRSPLPASRTRPASRRRS